MSWRLLNRALRALPCIVQRAEHANWKVNQGNTRSISYVAFGHNGSEPSLHLCDDEPTQSPLVLDLDGDGVDVGAAAFFDHGGDGFAEATRWADEGDGVLVWDRNDDGVVNDGSELFGNNTVLANGEKAANGFAALAELDSNGDGVVNAADENFSDLRVMRWMDANEKGMMNGGAHSGRRNRAETIF